LAPKSIYLAHHFQALKLQENVIQLVGFEVLRVVAVESSVSWHLTPYSPMKVNKRFGGYITSIFRAKTSSEERSLHEAENKQNKKEITEL
jgi:hypothetical protein